MTGNERDPRLEGAWREASRDEPAAALDAAIRAEARRAVHAAPRRARDKHWWYPLAAAAMVAVIAVGLLQLTPPEHVTPTEVARAPAPAQRQAAETPQPAQREMRGVPAARLGAAAPASVGPDSSGRAAPPPAVGPDSSGSAAPLEKDALPPAPEAKPEPFPSDKLERAPPEAASDANVTPAPRAPASPQHPERAPSPATASSAQESASAPSARQPESFPAAPPAAAPQGAAPAPRRDALVASDEQARERSALAKATAPRAKQAPARSVEEWVKLIRQLRAEGKSAEAAKELADFRAAYGERADSLLPPDLRERP